MLFLTYCYSLATSDLPESIRYLSIYSFGMHWVSSTSTRDINYPLNKFCDKMQKAELPLVFSGWMCEETWRNEMQQKSEMVHEDAECFFFIQVLQIVQAQFEVCELHVWLQCNLIRPVGALTVCCTVNLLHLHTLWSKLIKYKTNATSIAPSLTLLSCSVLVNGYPIDQGHLFSMETAHEVHQL